MYLPSGDQSEKLYAVFALDQLGQFPVVNAYYIDVNAAGAAGQESDVPAVRRPSKIRHALSPFSQVSRSRTVSVGDIEVSFDYKGNAPAVW